jgi:hypothetical protein
MSLELHSADVAKFNALWASWASADGTSEIEATFKQLDYTGFLDVMKHLRAVGLSEEPQETKLNIMVQGGLRFTLVGERTISDYCKDNTLRGKSFVVIKKDRHVTEEGGISEVDLDEYDVRIKVRRELPMDPTHRQVVESLAKWSTLPKTFRYIKRYKFKSTTHLGIIFDASLVRSSRRAARGGYVPALTFEESQLTRQPIQYEMEVEATPEAKSPMSLLVGITTVLRGIQRSYDLVRKSVRSEVLALMSAQTGAAAGGFPGPQPATFLRENMALVPADGAPNLRFTDYNVTDKADGLRCLLIVARDGRLYMVDRSLNVYGTGRRLSATDTESWGGAILDGEWVTQNAVNEPMSRYYAFDIYNGERGEDVCGRPFLVRGDGPAVSRNAALTKAVGVLGAANYTLKKVPESNKFTIHMKTFKTPRDGGKYEDIFGLAASFLAKQRDDEAAGTATYHTDGLIFTPNAAPLPKNVSGKWAQQFKWKPASHNSVDFLVTTEKVRDADGRPTAVEFITTKYNEATSQMMRVKTLRLFVGSSLHPRREKPREAILMKKPLPRPAELNADYRPVEFSPQPPDPMAAVCYVPLDAGASDAAGAAPAAQARDALDNNIYCDSGDPIENRSIVEMVYDPKMPAGFRWKPMRVRWDKTEQFGRGKILGTLNGEGTANDVWLSIHEPVTETMISTGAVDDASADDDGLAAGPVTYYQRKASQRDLFKIRGLTDFHNKYVKNLLIKRALRDKGMSLVDMSVGQAGDIHRWVDQQAEWVLGCDIAESGLVDNRNGAYRRYVDKLISARGPIPKMLFIQADSSKRYADGAAGMTPEDRVMLRALWGEPEGAVPPAVAELAGKARMGFDAATLMFSLHYMFKDRGTLDGLLRNLAETVKVGGLFVGCCFDGDAVASLLAATPLDGVQRGSEGGTEIWSIVKRYDDATGVVLPTEAGLGRAIDVNFISIGERYTEYLVSYPYLVERMKDVGFEVLNDDELGELGLPASSMMFKDTHELAKTAGHTFPMSSAVRTFSFLNRWFIFRRRRALALEAAVVAELPSLSPAAPSPLVVAEGPTVVPQVAEVEAELAAPSAPLSVVSPLPADEEVEVEEEEAAAAAAASGITIATGEIYEFNHTSAAATKAELTKLGIADKHWRKYISTFAPYAFKDPMNPAVKYPNLEAALTAAKYRLATNMPELGAQLFSTTGKIHQDILAKQRALEGEGAAKRALTEKEVAELIKEEGTAMKDAAKPTEIRKTGAKLRPADWDAAQEQVLVDLVRERFEGDAKFAQIVTALGAQSARLVFKGTATNELAGSEEGGAIKGANLYGRALMRAVGLTY